MTNNLNILIQKGNISKFDIVLKFLETSVKFTNKQTNKSCIELNLVSMDNAALTQSCVSPKHFVQKVLRLD